MKIILIHLKNFQLLNTKVHRYIPNKKPDEVNHLSNQKGNRNQ